MRKQADPVTVLNLNEGNAPGWLRDLHERLAEHLDGIKSIFKDDSKPKVTLVIRNTGAEDSDVVIGDDDLDEAVSCILDFQRRAKECGS